MKKVSIINYGLSNLLSVQRAFEKIGAETQIINTPQQIMQAQRLVLPGVGAFGDGMQRLSSLNLIDPIQQAAKNGVPLLGICLGMQMLFDTSEEFGIHNGLSLIKGKVQKIPLQDIYGNRHCVPNVGWHALLYANENGFKNTLLCSTLEKQEMYFVHSFMAIPANKQDNIAVIEYGGQKICAAAQNKNVVGCQFHPEKSGEAGLNILTAFKQM